MAGKFVDKVKYFMGFPSREQEEEYQEEGKDEEMALEREIPSSNVLNFRSTPSSVSSIQSASLKVVLYQPQEFEDAKAIVDNLKAQKPVVVNLETLEGNQAKKIFDFCNGAIYALDGRVEKISRGIFILAPKNVDVLGDVKNELAGKGVFSWPTHE